MPVSVSFTHSSAHQSICTDHPQSHTANRHSRAQLCKGPQSLAWICFPPHITFSHYGFQKQLYLKMAHLAIIPHRSKFLFLFVCSPSWQCGPCSCSNPHFTFCTHREVVLMASHLGHTTFLRLCRQFVSRLAVFILNAGRWGLRQDGRTVIGAQTDTTTRLLLYRYRKSLTNLSPSIFQLFFFLSDSSHTQRIRTKIPCSLNE